MQNSFHGRTFGGISVTFPEKYRHPFAPLLPGVEFVKLAMSRPNPNSTTPSAPSSSKPSRVKARASVSEAYWNRAAL